MSCVRRRKSFASVRSAADEFGCSSSYQLVEGGKGA